MKKFLTLLLALAMTLSLAACGSDSTEETEGTDRTEAETVDYTAMSDDELKAAIQKEIKSKHHDLVGNMSSEGTTPRQYTDLLGSLCDLTSGSGDKGTPFIGIQNYFTNYAE